MADNNGTPKNLEDAIDMALQFGPAKQGRIKLSLNVRDFLAQKFQAAFLRAETQEELNRLEMLWLQITKADEGAA